MFFSKQVFFPNQTNQGLFCQVSGSVLSPNTPKQPCSTVSLQHSWLSNQPGCQRTNDPGSRAEQAPRQQEQQERSQRFGITGALPPELLPTATEQLSDLGSPLQSCWSHTAWYILVPPGQELIPPMPSQNFLFKIFSFQSEASQ